ncbi:MAG TPA: cysteine--tRNA ligase [Candidatus Binatia bacterium]|nr:cysteine--tRNA ligase [Candidatus Binatia bacterium]
MLTLYNTLTRKKEEFKPITKGKVGLYTCGPTVYDYAHIGNLRSYIFTDILVRTLKANGYDVVSVMNITDVDDKTIRRSQEEKSSLKEVTEKYTEVFLEDLTRINSLRPDHMPKATEHIEGMVEMIKTLLNKGFAYKTDNGDIYFDISKDENYGELAKVDLTQLKQNAEGRLNNADEYDKEDIHDFALWKAYDQADGDVFWETEIGKGRPGWHIECSVMSAKHLGQPFDIHAGGVDLMFPHHTNEIAQSMAATGKPLANVWLHPEHLLVENSKMSKSKNNYYTSKDILEKGFSHLAFRYLTLSSHYRTKLNFTWESLQGAQNALNNLYKAVSVYSEAKTGLPEFEQSFQDAIDDDLNTPKALAVVWDMVNSENNSGDKLASLLKFDEVLGLKIKDIWEAAILVPDTVRKLVEERDEARRNKDFSRSDELRQAIESNGFLVEDTPDGTKLKKNF